ncbi:MAG: hypothetical protein KC636_33640 [Myxococcales bacterium]|nr:hypothetical protein [Myxococcales bacterium]
MPARRRSKRAASVAPRGRVGPPSARLGLLLTALVTVAVASPVAAEEPVELPADAPPEPEPPPTWRFRKDDRSVKVVVLAGSIGAWPKKPYAEQLEDMCSNIEVKNLSKVGYGAFQLKQRFKDQVLANPYLGLGKDDREFWVIFQGGLNSVGNPQQTNHHIRDLFLRAHARGLKVVALSLTPWGDDEDKRWRGIAGLRPLRATRTVVDFVLGKLGPEEALGGQARRRKVDASAPWTAEEKPEVAVDLYRTSLRDSEAAPRDVDAMKAALERDRTWARAHQDLDDAARAAALQRDAEEAAEIPRWYMKKELRSFDHIHPNTDGHTLIAAEVCPALPDNWGCACPERPEPPPPPLEFFGRPYEDWAWGLLRVIVGVSGGRG